MICLVGEFGEKVHYVVLYSELMKSYLKPTAWYGYLAFKILTVSFLYPQKQYYQRAPFT
jgi:hypothetical protein